MFQSESYLKLLTVSPQKTAKIEINTTENTLYLNQLLYTTL